jgi:hypothetical protein
MFAPSIWAMLQGSSQALGFGQASGIRQDGEENFDAQK